MSERVAEWYERYHAEILSYVRRLTNGHADAEDICSRVWLAALRFADRDLKRGWFYAVAQSRVVDWSRERTHMPIEDVQPRVEQFEERVLDRMEIAALLQSLKTEKQRTVAYLYFVEDRSLEEVAQCLSLTHGGAQLLVHRARVFLRHTWNCALT